MTASARVMRRLSLLVLVIFSLTFVTVPKDDNGFPLSWLWSWASDGKAWAQEITGLPVQTRGNAPKGHYVDGNATKANRGAGRAPDRVKGGVRAYQPFVPKILKATTLRSAALRAAAAKSGAAKSGAAKSGAAKSTQDASRVSAMSSGGIPQVDVRHPANNTALSTLTPQLFARGHDSDNHPNTGLKYGFAVFDEAGNVLAESEFESANSWTVPGGKFKWGQTYLYTVQMFDGENYSADPEAFAITTPVPQPALSSRLGEVSDKGFDPGNGNYTMAATDAEVESVGPELEIARKYNSLDLRTTQALGRGWSSILDSRATESKDANGNLQTVIVTYPDGQDVAFGRQPDGSFIAPAGRYSRLASSGGYILTDKDATVYRFTQSAGGGVFKLASITDANGRALTFTFNGSNQATKLTGASGRSLYFNWATPAGGNYAHVVEIYTDPTTAGDWNTAKTWKYTFDNDQLTKVCSPVSYTACQTYEHQWVSQYPNAVQNESPLSYWRLNEDPASSVLMNTGIDNAVYSNVVADPPALDGSTSKSSRFNGTSSYVQLPGKMVSDAAYQTISLWFKTTAVNGVLFSYNEKPITDGTTPGNYTPALYVGNDGKLRGQFWQGDARHPITSSAAVNDGNWHHVVLSGAGNTQTLYVDGYAQGTLAGTIVPNINGNCTVYIGAGFLGGDWPNQHKTGQYPAVASYFNGSISDVAYFGRGLSSASAYDLFNVGKWPRSALTKVVRPSGATSAQVNYDMATGKVNTLTDENGGLWTIGKPTVGGNSGVYAGSVLGGKPADYYRLGDPAGTPNPVNVVAGGQATYRSVTLGATGPFADVKAAQFNGSSSYVELPSADVPTTGPNTISMWFNMPANNWTGGVLYAYQMAPMTDLGNGYHHTPALYVGNDGKLHGGLWTGATNSHLISPATVNDGKWHHVALTAGDNNQIVYLDGVKLGHINATIQRTDATRAFLGAGKWEGDWANHGSSSAGYFPGAIAEYAFYRSKLTLEQVKAQFDASKQATPIAVAKVASGVTAIPMPVSTVEVTDPGGRKLAYSYDLINGNRTVAERDALGNVSKIGYDIGGKSNLVFDPLGVMEESINDVRGNVLQSITCQNQAGNKCSSVYYSYFPDATTLLPNPDPRNDVMMTMRDGRSSSSSDNTYLINYVYDAKGNQTEAAETLNSKTVTAYTDGTSVAAFDGGFAPAGLPMKVTAPSGATESFVYFKSGDIARATDSTGKVTAYTVDGLGRTLTETEYTDAFPSGVVTSFTYDNLGRVLTQTEPGIVNRITGATHTSVTTTTYNADGLVTQQQIGDSTGGDAARIVKTAFNAYGQMESETDATGATTYYQYDAYGHMVKETEPDGGVTLNTYDAEGNLLTTAIAGFNDGSGPRDLITQSHTYDPANRLASTTDAMGWTVKKTYTDNGLVARVIKTDGVSTFVAEDNTYDAAGHLTSHVTNNGATVTAYTYDSAGRRVSSTVDPAGLKRTTTYGYSKDDDLISERETDASGTTLGLVEHMYDAEDHLLAKTEYKTGGLTPVGRWRLEGNLADVSGNNPVNWTGGSSNFDGTGYLKSVSPAIDSAASFSVSAWVYLGEATNYKRAVSANGKRQSAFDLRYQQDRNRWVFNMDKRDVDNGGGSQAVSTSTPALNTWTHLTATYDANSGAMQLYVNGNLECTGNNPSAFTATGPLMIGAGVWNGNLVDQWKGNVKDVQLYQKVLSGSDITAIKNGGAPSADATVIRESYNVDNDGLVRSAVDPRGYVSDYVYDQDGRVTQTTAPAVMAERAGETPVSARPITLTGYDTFDHPTHSQDPNGNVSVTTYDAGGHTLSASMPSYTPLGSSTPITSVSTATYNELGQMVTRKDPLGNTTTYTYDQLDRLIKTVAPNGGVTKYTYDLNGQILSVTDEIGAVTTTTYDYLGRTLTSSEVERQPASVSTTTYTYGLGGWPTQVRSPAGVTTSTTYNAIGEVLTQTDGAGSVTSYTYDGAGRVIKQTRPDGTYMTVTYDMADRQLSTTEYSAAGVALATTASVYDAEGNLTAATDARGTTVTFAYDPTGLILSERQPVSGSDAIITSFGYDLEGNQTRFTDGRGNKFITTYNTWGLPESTIEPVTAAHPNAADRTFTVAYDAAGRVAKTTEPGGVTVTSTYDAMGNLTKATGAGAEVATTDRTFTYDLAGRMTNLSGNTLTYADRDLLLSVTGPSGNSSFSYDTDGRVVSRTDAAGTTAYTYDSAGRLATVDNATTATKSAIAYNSMSMATKITYGANGNARNLSYDPMHRLSVDELKSPSGTSLAKIAYGWDPNGNEISKTTTGFSGSASNVYTYDQADRLTAWNSTAYAYDKSGNRTQAGSKAFTYDERNRLIGGNGTSYTYTPRGSLRYAVTGGVSLESRVDAFGQVLRQYATATGFHDYTYDAIGRALRPGFAYSGLENDLAADGDATYTRGPDGNLLGVATSSAKMLAWTDLHTDVVGEFTSTGTSLAGSVTYDPLGKVISGAGMIGNLGYQSEWTDSLTGRVNMHARWYNVETGQFDTRDSVANGAVPDSINANRYQYANGNPLTITDPTGHWPKIKVPKFIKKAASYVANKVTSFVSGAANRVNEAAQFARDRAMRAAAMAKAAAKAVAKKATTKYKQAKRAVTKTYNYAKRKLVNGYNKVKNTVKKINNYAKQKLNQAKKFAADKAKKVKDKLKAVVNKAKQTGRDLVDKTKRAAKTAVDKVKDGYKATSTWVKEHKAEIAGFVVGAVVGVGCGAAIGWTGVGAVACGAAAGAAGSFVTGAMKGKTGMSLLKDTVVGGLLGGATSVLGPVAGRLLKSGAGAAFSGIRSGLSNLGGRIPPGIASKASALKNLLTRGCTKHSFDPKTLVKMANGATKPIASIKVGERVTATDPMTGATTAKPVTEVHVNKDADLSNVTVRNTETGKVSTLKTTQHHPFWNDATWSWVDAKNLLAGMRLRLATAGTVIVVAVTSWTGSAQMHDLTVADTHTYYVAAADAQILVHNCNTSGVYKSTGLSESELEGAAIQTRDNLAKKLSTMSQKKRPTTTTAGYNTETGEFAAGASSDLGCAEICVINALGGDKSKIQFVTAVMNRPNKLLEQQKVCLFCEARFGRGMFRSPETKFDSDVLRVHD